MCTYVFQLWTRHDQSLLYQLSLKDAPNCASRIFEKCTTLITRKAINKPAQYCIWSSSIVYHRLIYSTQSVGAMLWSMAQLRIGQLRMVVDVVGSLLMMWSTVCSGSPYSHAALSASPTSSWKLCIDRHQFAVCLGSSSVFDSVLLP